jgi:hypothetical protein
LCKLCFRHLEGKECWALRKVPNCNINSCGAPHHPMFHKALVASQAMIVQEVGGSAVKTSRWRWPERFIACTPFMICEPQRPSSLTPRPIQHSARLVSGQGGVCSESTCYYFVPIVDSNDKVQTIKAIGVAYIANLYALIPPSDIEEIPAGQRLGSSPSEISRQRGSANRPE